MAPMVEREGDDQQPPEQPEHRAAGQRQQRRAGQRQGGGQHVDDEIGACRQHRAGVAEGGDIGLARLECRQVQVLAEVEGEEGGDQREQGGDQRQFFQAHAVLGSAASMAPPQLLPCPAVQP